MKLLQKIIRVGAADLASTVKDGQENLLQAEAFMTRMRLLCRYVNIDSFGQKTRHLAKGSGKYRLEFSVLKLQKWGNCVWSPRGREGVAEGEDRE